MEKIHKMNQFIYWLENKVQSIHKLTNEQFINILEKI